MGDRPPLAGATNTNEQRLIRAPAPVSMGRIGRRAVAPRQHDGTGRMLDRHDPFPGLAVDRNWTIRRFNHAATRLFGAAGIKVGDDLLGQVVQNARLRAPILNYDDVIRHSLTRLRSEIAHFGADPMRQARIAQILRDHPGAADPPEGLHPSLIPIRYTTPAGPLSLFSVLAQFGSVEDITYAEIQIELMHPADDSSRVLLERLAQAAS